MNLTNREVEVMELICNGDSNNEIANKLIISTSTVKAHVMSIIEKLQAKNRAGAVYIFCTHKFS